MRNLTRYLLLSVALSLLVGWFTLFSAADPIETPIQKQLEALQKNQITEAYFTFTSEGFQETISLDKFKEFVRAYPILLHHEKQFFGKKMLEGNRASVTLYLTGKNEAEVNYQLIKGDPDWKIDRMEMVEYHQDSTDNSVNATAAMIRPIEAQLKALKANDLLTAYKGGTSKPFQQQTSFEAFKAFVNKYPLLKHYTQYDLKEHSFKDNHGIVTIVLNPTQEALSVEYRVIDEEGEWKILMMQIDADKTENKLKSEPKQPAMIELVHQGLFLLQQGNIKQVYDELLAKNTKEEVPFETFQTFIQTYPALINHTTVNIREPFIENGVGRVVAEALNNLGTTIIEFHLSNEDGVWKIIGMHIASTPEEAVEESETSPSAFKVRDLINVIEGFLTALRNQDMTKAFEYTSKEFQYSNSQEDFNQFFIKHPEFMASKGSSFAKELFNNAIATFSGHLILAENKLMPVEFDLVLQDGIWKILHLYALPIEDPSKKPASNLLNDNALEFSDLQLGTKVDDEGKIINPKTIFKSDSGDLYVSIKLRNGNPGLEITLLLRHIDSGSSLKPVKATLTETGDETLTFLFSPPPHGWPKGSYQLRASSSTNVFKNYNFIVE